MPARTTLVPDLDLARIRRYCADRIPERVAHQVRLDVEVDGRAVTIVERRPPWRPEFGPEWSSMPIARLRYVTTRHQWTLYWHDQHGRFQRYPFIRPSPSIDALLAEIEADPTNIFWG